MQKMKIKTKLFILCGVLAIIPSLIVLFSFYEMAEEVTSNIFKDLLFEYNQQLLNSFDRTISEKELDLQDFVKHLSKSPYRLSEETIYNDLVELRNRQKIFESVEIVTDQFIVVNHSSRAHIGERSKAFRQFQKVKIDKNPLVELVRIEELNKTVLRIILHFNKNKVDFYILAQIPSDRIKGFLALSQKPIGGHINPEIIIKSIEGLTTFSSSSILGWPKLNLDFKSISNQESKTIDLGSEGHLLISRLDNWIAISHVNEDEVHLPIHQLRNTLLYALVAFYILVFIILHYLMNFLLKPIVSIMHEMSHMKEGQFRPVKYDGLVNDEFSELVSVFNNMQDQLQKRIVNLTQTSKLAALGEMAAGIAHEINNPLQVIYGSISSIGLKIKNSNVDEKTKNEISKLESRVQNTIQRIAKIIQGLKFYSRDNDEDSVKLEQIQKIIESTLDFCQERFKKYDIEIRVNLSSNSISCHCIYSQISQIILNLLNNAFDAVTTAHGRWVSIDLREDDQNIFIEIQNDGPKITDEIAAKAFLPFFTTKDTNKGTGLGLSVSLGIAEKHGGKLLIDKTKPHTTFILYLPKNQPQKSNSTAA
jgi:signal transduction histidine kinase